MMTIVTYVQREGSRIVTLGLLVYSGMDPWKLLKKMVLIELP